MTELQSVSGVELRKLLADKKLIVGTDRALKILRLGKLVKIILSSNCPENISRDVKKYALLSNTEVICANQSNEQLGLLLKKPFHVSVVGVVRT